MIENLVFKNEVPAVNQYFKLFETTGWNADYQLNKEELYQAVSNSWYSLCAYDQNDELIGFGRLISDGVLYAFICDMIITPNYQRQGLGSTLLNKLIKHCKENEIRIVWLFSAGGKTDFYRKHGFVKRPSNAPGMQLSLR